MIFLCKWVVFTFCVEFLRRIRFSKLVFEGMNFVQVPCQIVGGVF